MRHRAYTWENMRMYMRKYACTRLRVYLRRVHVYVCVPVQVHVCVSVCFCLCIRALSLFMLLCIICNRRVLSSRQRCHLLLRFQKTLTSFARVFFTNVRIRSKTFELPAATGCFGINLFADERCEWPIVLKWKWRSKLGRPPQCGCCNPLIASNSFKS